MSEVKRFTRIVRTEEGGSAFEEDELRLDEQRIASGVPPTLVGRMSSSAAEVLFLLSATKFDIEPHPAPRRQWVVPLRGRFEVEVSSGERRRFGPGDLVFAADTTGKGHVTVSFGEPPFEVLFVPTD